MLVAQDRTTTAALLAHIAEVDARRLYLPAAYPSMFAYCLHELRLSEDSAYKRIQAARTAREFPVIFDALAEGRLHLSAVCLLAPYLKPENADALLNVAAHKTKSETEELLAERFPRSELLALVQAIPASSPALANGQLAPGQVETRAAEHVGAAEQLAPGQVGPAPRSKVAPVAPERFLLQLTIGRSTHDKLQHAQALLSHEILPGDVAQCSTALWMSSSTGSRGESLPPPPSRAPARVAPRQASGTSRRTSSAPSGSATAAAALSLAGRVNGARRAPFWNMTMLTQWHSGARRRSSGSVCSADLHNQFAAERTFGTDFMRRKREEARRARAEARAAAARQAAEARAQAAAAAERAKELDVIPCLRQLGLRPDEARRAAAYCDDTVPDAPLEERLRVALRFHGRGLARRWCPAAGSSASPITD